MFNLKFYSILFAKFIYFTANSIKIKLWLFLLQNIHQNLQVKSLNGN